jgi:putative thioredoxin
MIVVTEGSFQSDVIEASRRQPVLADFWAPWCGPCRVLGPMLEKIEREQVGKLGVVKINVDENPDLAAQFQVRSIPFVVAFVDGNAVDSFTGVLPEPQLRAFVERLVPNPSELERRKAASLLAAGDTDGALCALRAALALDPSDDASRLDLVEILVRPARHDAGREAIEEAAGLLARVGAAHRHSPRYAALHTVVQGLANAAALPPVETLRARVASQPADLQARLDLANALIAHRHYAPALDELLEIVGRDRAFGDDIGRRTALAVFELISDQPQVVGAYRRRLAAALNR